MSVAKPIRVANEELNKILDKAKKSADDDLETFAGKPGKILGEAIFAYGQLLTEMKVPSFEKLYALGNSNNDLASAVKEIRRTQEQWDSLLKSIDAKISAVPTMNSSLEIGQPAPNSLLLESLESGEEFNLDQLIDDCKKEYLHLVLLRHFA